MHFGQPHEIFRAINKHFFNHILLIIPLVIVWVGNVVNIVKIKFTIRQRRKMTNRGEKVSEEEIWRATKILMSFSFVFGVQALLVYSISIMENFGIEFDTYTMWVINDIKDMIHVTYCSSFFFIHIAINPAFKVELEKTKRSLTSTFSLKT